MTARSIGTATISFGLVSIPAKLYTTNETVADISFHMLHDTDSGRLKQQYICTTCNEVVDREHTIKGYEHAKGQHVVITAEELKALDAIATQTIAIEEFVPAGAVDPLYVEKSYYLGPDKGGERAYALIARAMAETGLEGVASYSARGKQYIVLLRPFRQGLIIHQLRYPEEVKAWDEVPVPELPEVREAEIGLATQIIAGLARETFEPAKYKDEVKARTIELLAQKVAGEPIVVATVEPGGQVIDIMEALRKSLALNPPPVAAPAPVKPIARTPRARAGARKVRRATKRAAAKKRQPIRKLGR